MLAAIRSKRRESKSRLGYDVITRFDGQPADAIKVDVQQLPVALHVHIY